MKTNRLSDLDLTLVIGCKLNCRYCPQNLLVSQYFRENKERKRKLSFEDFKTAVDKLEEGATVGFVGLAEPFLNERCADMIVYAYEKGYKISLYTTLVGMTDEDLEKIQNVKFDRVVVHIPDKENNSKFIITDDFLHNLKMFHEKINVNYYSCHGSIHPAVMNIIDQNKYAGLELQNRAGNLEIEGFDELNWRGKISCYRAWSSSAWSVSFMPEMLPDGTLLFCCQDYGLKHQIGNLVEQSWDEIQENAEYRKVLDGFKDDSIDTLCRKCSCAKPVDKLPTMQFRDAVLAKKKEGMCQGGSLDSKDLVDRFANAEKICVFGLGKLFREHFYQEYWHEGLNVSIFSDNNTEYWGKEIKGIKCVNPIELEKYDNILVVLFVKNNCSEIASQLSKRGITNCISISEVLDYCNRLSKVNEK